MMVTQVQMINLTLMKHIYFANIPDLYAPALLINSVMPQMCISRFVLPYIIREFHPII